VTGTGDTSDNWNGATYIDQSASVAASNGTVYYGGDGFSGDRATIQAELGAAASSQGQGSSGVAQSALAQAAEMAAGPATTAETSPDVYLGARWNTQTITWSLDTSGGNAAYDSEVEQAFATWAAASGLNFQEVASGSGADISIGWGDLNTAATGQVGFTSFSASNGVISGSQIQLESSSDLTTDSSGDTIYAGTDATLYQTALHEIGHALGLGDNADATSIMNYDLTSANQTLDQTDLHAIGTLYGSSAQTAALIQAMSGGTADGAGSISAPVDTTSQHTQLIAASH
jgi:predicted Zn-dependent protease